MTTQVCDGCGQTVEPGHLRARILRLEAATRFRPLHIATLLVADAPPARMEDDFYYVGTSPAPSADALFFREQMLEAVGIKTSGKTPEVELPEFQRLGLYLAYFHECPLEDAKGETLRTEEASSARIRALAIRIRHSYKPKRVVWLGQESVGMAAHLRIAGVEEHLLRPGEDSIPLPGRNNAKQTAAFRDGMARIRSMVAGQ